MNISEILGAMVQSGMSPSSMDRMKNSLGGSNELDNLSGAVGGASVQSAGGGIADVLSSVLGGSGSKSGGIGDVLSNMLGDAGKAVGGNKNLAIGGLGALIGSILGGGGKSVGGAIGGGLMALLGSLAFNALKGAGKSNPQIPTGLLEPTTDDEQKLLDQSSELILRSMINAAKSDGQIDQNEINRIIGKFDEMGIDDEGKNYLMIEMQKPIETDKIIAEAQGQPELAAQMYAATLMAIEVDTQQEKNYLDQLAIGLGLEPQVISRIHQLVGFQPV